MDNEKYAGWANHATWAFNLWLSNSESNYKDWLETAKEAQDIESLAVKMKDFLIQLSGVIIDAPELTTRENRMMILEIGDIDDIDYFEIAKAWFEDAR